MNKMTLILIILIMVMIFGLFFLLQPYHEEKSSNPDKSIGSKVEPPTGGSTGPAVSVDEVRKKLID